MLNAKELEDYFEFIKLNPGDTIPTLGLLKDVVAAHLRAFPYQNTDLFQQGLKKTEDRAVSALEIKSIFEQMVIKNGAGYCFQNTELLAAVLTSLGFKLEKYLAKIMNSPSEKLSEKKRDDIPFSHIVLVVEVQEMDLTTKWIVDSGFANNSLREPVALAAGEQKVGPDNYRLSFHPEGVRLELKTPQNWFCLYEYADQPASNPEIREAHRQMFKGEITPTILTFFKSGVVDTVKRKEAVAIPATDMYYKSTSSSNKEYELVLNKPRIRLTRHTIAVEPIHGNFFNYTVLAPDCPKIRKFTLTNRITLADIEKIIGKEKALVLWGNLEGKEGERFLETLAPSLSVILEITAARGDTHKRLRKFTNVEEFAAVTREKLGINVCRATLFTKFPRRPQLRERTYADFESQLGKNALLGVHYMVLSQEKKIIGSSGYKNDQLRLMAGTGKVALALCVLYTIFGKKTLLLKDVVTINDEDFLPGSVESPLDKYYSILESKKIQCSVESLLSIMLEHGDNTATDKLFQIVGGPAKVTKFMGGLRLGNFNASRDSKQFLEEYYPYNSVEDIGYRIAYFQRVINAYEARDTETILATQEHDVSTPEFMTNLLHFLLCPPPELPWLPESAEFLLDKMRSCKTGAGLIFNSAYNNYGSLITGIGNNNSSLGGITNDVAFIELKDGRTILLAIFSCFSAVNYKEREAIIGNLTTHILENVLDPELQEHQDQSMVPCL